MSRFLWMVLYVHLALLTFAAFAGVFGVILLGVFVSPWWFFGVPVEIGVTVALWIATAWAADSW